jgi:hypothetical protein
MICLHFEQRVPVLCTARRNTAYIVVYYNSLYCYNTWRPGSNSWLTHSLLILRKSVINLNVVALIPLCKILKDTDLSITNTCCFVHLHIKMKGSREITSFFFIPDFPTLWVSPLFLSGIHTHVHTHTHTQCVPKINMFLLRVYCNFWSVKFFCIFAKNFVVEMCGCKVYPILWTRDAKQMELFCVILVCIWLK